MTHTFRTLAIGLALAILLSIALGFASFFTEGNDKDVFVWHFVFGLVTVLAMLLVHCLIFIYFLGTGRWVKEVAIAYKLPDEPWPKQTRELKRATFPPALFSMLFGIATAAAGAGAQLQSWPWYVHMTLGLSTMMVNLWAFRIELRNLSINARIIDAVMRDVERLRFEAGLNSNDEALRDDHETETSIRA